MKLFDAMLKCQTKLVFVTMINLMTLITVRRCKCKAILIMHTGDLGLFMPVTRYKLCLKIAKGAVHINKCFSE
jgi:hypothetical protein